ncbi:PREDICTED: uncharacterized protein LOC109219552 [Nicotiana attenuata]|uniref:uncharacterized protein LOC109219552 n=1 Tax=Nicotiana attenuata TaxID=49451 RepID=UPI00090507D3|nr:PREDICTED: uncharacterized protein LOC109219552 [Nicotiana attenuata]
MKRPAGSLHVKKFGADNAFELGGSSKAKAFFSENGILHHTTVPQTPQQNGVPFSVASFEDSIPSSSSLSSPPQALPSAPSSPQVLPLIPPSSSPLPSSVPNSPTPPPLPQSLPLRKSTRICHTPSYLKDYVCSSAVTKPDYAVVTKPIPTISKVSPDELHMQEPLYYQQAASHPAWQEAMLQEFKALDANHTWDIFPLSPNKKPIPCKWVYKIKQKPDGSIESYKARLVIRGDTQKEGIDYNETFSPVVNFTTIKCLFCLAAKRNWTVYQLDVNNAFLHGDLHEEVYMKPTPGLQISAPWLQGYISSKNDYSLFTKSSSSSLTVIVVYDDDILLAGDDVNELDTLKSFLDCQFKIKDLGFIHYFLVLEVPKTPQGYLHTRPNIAFVVQHLSQFLQTPQAACTQSRKSVTSFFITFGGRPIS